MSQSIMYRVLYCRSCLNQAASLGRGQTRFFTSSGTYKRAWIPTFKPTSSKNLDELLSLFRDRVFIPAFLTPAQRRLIYKEDATTSLEQNPITVTLQGQTEESYRLRPLKFSETPSNNAVRDIVELMKEPEDWYTLVPLLKGLHSSKRKPNFLLWEFIVRKAGEAGMNSVIIDCAEQSRRTGFSLGDYVLTELLFSNLHLKAESAGYKGPEVEKALKQAKHVAMLMNAEDHMPVDKTKPDPRRHPNIIAVLLELSAARALDAFEGKDTQGDVRSYAEKLLGTWVLRGKFDTIKYPKKNVRNVTDLPSVRKGIEMALQVEEIKNDEKLSQALRERLNELGTPADGTRA
ncbi:hypothetical protein BDBG_01310 [Blastomyces gilchristii SLH14081]|uniref:Uncharacterized protein n=1 Tax=Blastomyces gilchristii (strain SLH14081) TaxID=559298 RepID=A0A179UAR9_BLAGS|nr:uncharacterized protein BDBG_01310 [Blastomyces gilchristii SLH14081]OAT04813.1 hypothetical protein BDBG_01310 [Blastomyces gilchristii SLH14081]